MHCVIDLIKYNFLTLWQPTLKYVLDKTEFKVAAIILFFSFQFMSFQNQKHPSHQYDFQLAALIS